MTTSTTDTAGDKPDPFDSPTFLLATMFSARRSGDVVLERLAARRLAELGIRVQFADALPRPARRKAVARD
jgi:hypothetical protein